MTRIKWIYTGVLSVIIRLIRVLKVRVLLTNNLINTNINN